MDLAIEEDRAMRQPFERKAGFEPRDLGPREHPMTRHLSAAGQQIVEPESGPIKQARRPAVQRDQKWLRRNQVRREIQQDCAFPQRFTNQMKPELLQVTQPAMDELRILAAGAGCEVPLLDQRHFDASQRQIPHDACAVDAAAQDQHFECLVFQTL